MGLAAALALQSGCYKATFQSGAASAVRGEEHYETTPFFVFGLVGEETVDVSRFCEGSEIAEVQAGMGFVQGLFGVLTLGIYTPRRVKVTCVAQGQTAGRELHIQADAGGRPVAAQLVSEGGRKSLQVHEESARVWRLSAREVL